MDYRQQQEHAEHVAFCDNLAREGKIFESDKSLAVSILDCVAAGNLVNGVTFSEGGAERRMSLVTAMKRLLSSMPVSKGQAQETAIVGFMEQNEGVSYREALLAVSQKSPELFDLQSNAYAYKSGINDEEREVEIARFMEANSETSYSRAFLEVSKLKPQLFDIPTGSLH